MREYTCTCVSTCTCKLVHGTGKTQKTQEDSLVFVCVYVCVCVCVYVWECVCVHVQCIYMYFAKVSLSWKNRKIYHHAPPLKAVGSINTHHNAVSPLTSYSRHTHTHTHAHSPDTNTKCIYMHTLMAPQTLTHNSYMHTKYTFISQTHTTCTLYMYMYMHTLMGPL